jgi:hypothetical protein
MRKKNNLHYLLTLLLAWVVLQPVAAQDFDKYFTDATLRIDYTFTGNFYEQRINVDELVRLPHWWGKRHRLSEVPVRGNGQITVRHHASGEVIYRNSFGTLFQEWLSYEESKGASHSFENVFLVPMPKDTADVTVELFDNRQEPMATLTHMVAPDDILIRHAGEHNVTPHQRMQAAADSTRCIRIAYVAEGYQESEMPLFLEDVSRCMDALFSHEPFRSLRDRFEVTAVLSPSTDSGTSIPHAGVWKQTALHSHFDTFYSNRYLTTLHLKDLHDWLAGIAYEHIIVLVNTDQYGGGGILNSYNLSMAHHEKTLPVVVHEFGHSFAGLADEYAYENEAIPMYPHDVEPWEPNITTLVDLKSKWADLTEKYPKEVGLYEGAGYSTKGVYRACPDCRMRTNENPTFCKVCDRALRRLIDFYTKY